MKIGYYINDRFVLDNGKDAGINIMLFNGDKLDYFFDEFRCETIEQANNFIKNYDAEMIEITLKHPIGNRRYSIEEMMSFTNFPENEHIFSDGES